MIWQPLKKEGLIRTQRDNTKPKTNSQFSLNINLVRSLANDLSWQSFLTGSVVVCSIVISIQRQSIFKKIPLNTCSQTANWNNTRWIPFTQQSTCACILLVHTLFPTDALYGAVASAETKQTREPIAGSKNRKRRAPPAANAKDEEHCGKQGDCVG